MQEISEAIQAMKFGGITIYPLVFLAILALVIIIDKLYLYRRYIRLAEIIVQPDRNLRLRLGKTGTGTGGTPAGKLLRQVFPHRYG